MISTLSSGTCSASFSFTLSWFLFPSPTFPLPWVSRLGREAQHPKAVHIGGGLGGHNCIKGTCSFIESFIH